MRIEAKRVIAAPDLGLYRRACWPLRGVDGDTGDYLVDLGEREYAIRRFRMMGISTGIDTPELSEKDEGQRTRARLAQQFLLSWHRSHVGHNTVTFSFPVITSDLTRLGLTMDKVELPMFISESAKSDVFGRWLDAVFCQQFHNLGDDLVAAGLADIWQS